MHRYAGLIGVLSFAFWATACGEDPAGLGQVDSGEDAGVLKLDAGFHPDATGFADASDSDGGTFADAEPGDAADPDGGSDDSGIGDSGPGPRTPQNLYTPVSGGGVTAGATHRVWIVVGGSTAQGAANNGSHRVVFGPPLPRR